MVATGGIILLYFWTFLSGATGAGILISSQAIFMASATFLVAIVCYLWIPKKHIIISTAIVYIAMAVTAACLIATSQGLVSPFVALWILVAIFAAILGMYGLVPMFLISNFYILRGLIDGDMHQTTIVVTLLAGWLPLAASFIIWHSRRVSSDNHESAYRNLASELNEVANKSEVVINAIADGVMAVDGQGTIQLLNPAAQTITGWGKQDATKLNYKSVLKLTDSKDQELAATTDPIQQALNTNQEIHDDSLSLTTHSGKKLLTSIAVSPVGQAGAGVIIVFRDVTKDKQEERAQAEFISTASHEMRTPVASIEGYLGLALNPNTAQVDVRARDYIGKAHESAQHLGRLFQDLLDVSRADDGRLSNNPKVVDVVSFTQNIIEGLKPQADAKQLHLTYKPGLTKQAEGDRHLNPIYFANVDNDHLREVIANLTENAIKYTLAGDIVVDVSGDSDHVVVSFKDSGIGIPSEDISHLFQKFYRVDNTDTREIGGTGLGLYLCRRLAEMMGGRIWVESEYKKGSTFYLELPRIDHQEATQLIESAKHAPVIQPSVAIQTAIAPSQPLPTASTVPVATPVQAPPQQPQPSPPPAAPSPPNTPLSAIERDPGHFIQPRSSTVAIPERGQTQQQ